MKSSSAALKKFEDRFSKTFGADTLKRSTEITPYPVISTGSLTLDYRLTVGGYVEGRLVEIWGPDGVGKGHPYGTPILTPHGWTPIEDVEVGDAVIGSDGFVTEVEGVYDRGELPVYRVTFNDGASVLCDADHLWRVRASKGWVTYDTRTLVEDKTIITPEGTCRYHIPLVEPVQFDWVDLPFDAYVMGALLANGHLDGTPYIRTNEDAIVARIRESREITKEYPNGGGIAIHDARDRLRTLGLYGLRSGRKFIPRVYLHAHEQARRELLHGLMDCDGSSAVNHAEYHSSSEQLARDVQELVRSLGGIARINSYERTHPDGRPYTMYRVGVTIGFNPFTLRRKSVKWRVPTRLSRKIQSIELEGSQMVRCIRVAAEDSLYVTQDYIVTHNTTLSLLGLAEAQKKHEDKMVAFIDMEQKFDRSWAVAHGIDLERLYLYSPESAEDVADALKEFCSSGLFSMVVLDSVGGMLPEAEKEKDADQVVVGKQANIVTRMVKIAAVEAAKSGTAVILLNQVRANLGYGADTTTGGGFALKHVTTMKFKMRRTGTTPFKAKVGNEDRVVGHEIAIEVQRNGVAPAYRTAIVSIFHVATEKYGPLGIDRADEAATLGVDTGVIEQTGAWYTIPGGERVNGRERVVEALRADPNLLENIRTLILDSVAGEVIEEVDPSNIEDAEGDGPKFRKGRQDG